MLTNPIAIGVFLFVLTLIYGTYWMFVVRPEGQEQQAVRRRIAVRRTKAYASIAKARETLSGIGALDTVLTRLSAWTEPLRLLIHRSGLQLTLGAVILACVFFAILLGFVALYFTSSGLAALVAAIGAVWMPVLYLRWKATKRLYAFEEQFPESMDLIARALRAGHSLPTALQLVSEETPDPVGGEFKLLFDQQNFGLSFPDALRAFAERIPLLDARFFVTAVLIQRESGGNLSEVLDNLASVIRERFKVKRQVRVVSAHGRITGWVLGALPPAVALVLFIISPDHIRLLVDDPLGLYMLGTAIVLQFIGVIWIRRAIAVEY